jgi:DNA-binding winged helix-turn-helix (wHTH) protein
MHVSHSQTFTRYYKFGTFTLDVNKSVLLRDNEIIPLGNKAFELLLYLLQNSGKLLHKDELLRQVWPEAIVDENNLARQISSIRKALSEDQNIQQHILTVPGRGYRDNNSG